MYVDQAGGLADLDPNKNNVERYDLWILALTKVLYLRRSKQYQDFVPSGIQPEL